MLGRKVCTPNDKQNRSTTRTEAVRITDPLTNRSKVSTKLGKLYAVGSIRGPDTRGMVSLLSNTLTLSLAELCAAYACLAAAANPRENNENS